MLRVLAFAFLGLVPLLPAQTSLQALQQQFRAEARALAAKQPTHEQRDALRARQLERLRTFVAGDATGDDRWNGLLMLADWQLANDQAAAADVLRSIDAKQAPAMVLVSAATMAQHLGLQQLRDDWVEAALTKTAPLVDRLAMGRILMSVLREVARGEKLFADALAAAADDEARSFIRWCKADALREREDLPDNAGFEELERLAADLPATYWGSVAKDRLRATMLAVGDPAIGFRASLRDGKPFALADQRGKCVVLAFWQAADHDTPTLVAVLQDLVRQHGEAVVPLGIALDRDAATIGDAIQKLGITFPVVGDGKGPENDIALRWFVEGPVVHVIDAAGKVAALGLHVGTADARAQVTEVVARAIKP